MFDEIINNRDLNKYLSSKCNENNIEAKICSKLVCNDDYLVVKVDNYYNNYPFKKKQIPKSIDCLIPIKCKIPKRKNIKKDIYNLYLIELKNIKSPQGFKIKDIEEKFKTTIDDFLKDRFKNLFDFEINNFYCYFISDPYGVKLKKRYKSITQEEYEKLFKSYNLRYYRRTILFKYKNKISMIKPVLPNPTICNC